MQVEMYDSESGVYSVTVLWKTLREFFCIGRFYKQMSHKNSTISTSDQSIRL